MEKDTRFSAISVEQNSENDVEYPDATPPWPEWIEEELTSTKWDEFDEFRYRTWPTVFGTDREFATKIGPEDVVWRRVHEQFPNDSMEEMKGEEPYKVVANNQPRFIQQDTVFALNRHLMGTEIFRMLLFALKNVSFINTFKGDFSWEPWQTVYKREYNPHGKYFVKLFFLGKWRRLVVDDYIPCDVTTGEILVPFLSTEQLWLPLLSKAIIVVASVYDFDWKQISIGNLLTGCFSHCVDTSDTSEADMWKIIVENVPPKKYSTEEEKSEADANETDLSGSNLPAEKPERYVLAIVDSTGVPDLNTSVPVEIQLVLNQSHLRKYAKNWKDIRYHKWAYEKGIVKEKLPCSNSIGHIQFFCPVRKMYAKTMSQMKIESEELETFIGDLTKPRKITPNEQEKQSNEDLPTSDEICTWLEFPKLYPYLIILETLYVPSSFEHQTHFTSAEELSVGSTCVDGGVPGEENEDSVGNFFRDLVLQPSFYVFSDSLQSITLFFVVSKCSIFTTKSSRIILQRQSDTQLTIEPYCWHNLELDFSDEKTVLCRDTVKLTISPGVNVFKVWYSAQEHFYVSIYSTDEFAIVPRCKLNFLLSQQSLHLTDLMKDIMSRFETLLTAPLGTPEHGQAYEEFIESFCPIQYFERTSHVNAKVEIKMKVLRNFEDILMEKIVNYKFDENDLSKEMSLPMELSETFLTDVGPPVINIILYLLIHCKQIFQDPAFGNRFLKLNAPHYRRLIKSSSVMLMSFCLPSKQTLISKQSMLVNSSKTKKGSLSMQQQRGTVKEMRRLAREEAARAKRISKLNSALKDIMMDSATDFYSLLAVVPGVKESDIIVSDLQHRVKLMEFSGSVEELGPDFWCLITRINLNLHSTTDCPVGIYVSTQNTEDCRLRYELVRNRILRSHPVSTAKMLNHVYLLGREEFGYTLLVYGYKPVRNSFESLSEQNMPTIKWNIQLISGRDTECALHICHLYPLQDIHISDLEENESKDKPTLFCNFGPSQSAPGVWVTRWSHHLEEGTTFDRLKFRLTTWNENIVSLRFNVESDFYRTRLKIIKRRCNNEESTVRLPSCPSFHIPDEMDESGNRHEFILTQESDNGELLVPAIITTHENCYHSNEAHSIENLTNVTLTLEGTIEIEYKPEADDLPEEMVHAKQVLIEQYLTRTSKSRNEKYLTAPESRKKKGIGLPIKGPSANSTHSLPDKEILNALSETEKQEYSCDLDPQNIPYSLIAFYTPNEAISSELEFSIHMETDLVDMADPAVNNAIASGKEKRTRFLCDVFKETPCLSGLRPKMTKFEEITTKVFGREYAETTDVERAEPGEKIDSEQLKYSPSDLCQFKLDFDAASMEEDSRDPWRLFYDGLSDELSPQLTPHDLIQNRLYSARERYIRLRHYEREKYKPNPPEEEVQMQSQHSGGKLSKSKKRKSSRGK